MPALLTLLTRLAACSPGGGAAPDDVATGPTCDVDHDWPFDVPANVLGARVVAGRAGAEDVAVIDGLRLYLDDARGPWARHVEGPWRGRIGEAFVAEGNATLDHASVPDVVVDDDGTRWLFFVDGDLDAMREAAARGEPMQAGWAGIGGLAAATSTGDRAWARVAIEVVGDDVPLFLVDPDVMRLPDGRWRLYAFAVGAEEACANSVDPSEALGAHHVWAADSEDLVHWVADGTVFDASDDATDPAVWCPSERTFGLFVPRPDEPPDSAVSTDGGLAFESSEVSLDVGHFATPDVLWTEDGAWMVAQGDARELAAWTSPDGVAWTQVGAPGLVGEAPTIVRDGDDVLMWTQAADW